jgi:hypothetical protein
MENACVSFLMVFGKKNKNCGSIRFRSLRFNVAQRRYCSSLELLGVPVPGTPAPGPGTLGGVLVDGRP